MKSTSSLVLCETLSDFSFQFCSSNSLRNEEKKRLEVIDKIFLDGNKNLRFHFPRLAIAS